MPSCTGIIKLPIWGESILMHTCMVTLRDFPEKNSAWMLIIHKGLGYFLCDFSISEWKPLTRNSGQAVLPWILAPGDCHVTCYIDRGIDPWADNDTLDKIRSTTCGFYDINCFARIFPIKPFGMSLPERASSCFCSGLPFLWHFSFPRLFVRSPVPKSFNERLAIFTNKAWTFLRFKWAVDGVGQLGGGTYPPKTNSTCHLERSNLSWN